MSVKKKKSFLPAKIKIGGLDYKIVFRERFKDGNSDYIGLCVNPMTTIYISKCDKEYQFDRTKIIQTLLHEIIHAIDNVYCNNSFQEDNVKNDMNDLEHLWFSVLADNDLYISKKDKFPDYVRILGQTYKIICNYNFELDDRNTMGVVTNFAIKEIQCSKNIDEEHIKIQILSSIQQVFMNAGYFDEEFPSLPFAQGLYQVLKDNKLDVFIRRYCKE